MGYRLTSGVFQRFEVLPSYVHGFEFVWEVTPGFTAPAPWSFTVMQAPTPQGPWTAISPLLSGVRRWHDDRKRIVPKSDTLWFMCKLTHGDRTRESAAVAPYAVLGRREFLIAREIMRKEVLHARTGAGVQILIYVVATSGPKCTVCLDPITGQVRDPACPSCHGTGRAEAYYGPYKAWTLITPRARTAGHQEGGMGVEEPSQFEMRMIASLPLKKNDIIGDPVTGRMYYVDASQNVAEMQRVPLVQNVYVLEAPTSDPAYNLKLKEEV